ATRRARPEAQDVTTIPLTPSPSPTRGEGSSRHVDAPIAPLLEVRGLRTHFFTSDGVVKAVDGVDLTIPKGKTLGLVGESGCGKSVTALSIMRLIPTPPGQIAGGQVAFEGRDLLALSEA